MSVFDCHTFAHFFFIVINKRRNCYFFPYIPNEGHHLFLLFFCCPCIDKSHLTIKTQALSNCVLNAWHLCGTKDVFEIASFQSADLWWRRILHRKCFIFRRKKPVPFYARPANIYGVSYSVFLSLRPSVTTALTIHLLRGLAKDLENVRFTCGSNPTLINCNLFL